MGGLEGAPRSAGVSSSGQWGSSHLCIEAFNELAGLNMSHVPPPTSPAAMDAVVAQSVAAYCPAGPTVHTFVQSGRIRPLGITYTKPTRLLPGVAPISDTLPGYELLGWYGLQMHLKTPRDLVNKVNADSVRALRLPEIQEKLFGLGVEAVGNSPAEFSAFLRKEQDRWSRLLKDRGAKPQ